MERQQPDAQPSFLQYEDACTPTPNQLRSPSVASPACQNLFPALAGPKTDLGRQQVELAVHPCGKDVQPHNGL